MPDSISFKYYPTTNRVPGVYVEVDPTLANTGTLNQRTLLIGQKLTAGTAPVGVPYQFSSLYDAQAAFGNGSQISIMAKRYRDIDAFGDLWCLPLADDPAAVVATGSLTLAGSPTSAGVISLYVAGQIVSSIANVADTPTVMATAMVAAINAISALPITATAALGVVTINSRNLGFAGNDIDLRLNFLGTPYEMTPPGVTATIVRMAAGATNPSTALTTALANIVGVWIFDFIGIAFNDPTSLNAIQSYLNDQTGTWSWLQEAFGHCFAGYNGSFGSITTYGTTHNDQHTTIMAVDQSPSPSWYWAADLTAACAVSIRADPAIPLQDIALNVVAPPIAARFYISERNTLLYEGISTYKVDQSGRVYTDRVITTYQKDSTGAVDNSYLDVETMATLTYVIRDIRSEMLLKFKRKKLVSDGSRIPPGSGMTTAALIALACAARYQVLALAGYVQNPAAFAKAVVGVNVGNGVVKVLLPLQLANQLRVIAMLVDFTKP